MEEWYYEDYGTQQGPVSKDALLRLIFDGQVTVESAVWREGMSAWTAVGALPELVPFPAMLSPAAVDSPPRIDYGRPAAAYVEPLSFAAGDFCLAGFWRRAVAYIIDSTIIGMPFMALGAAGVLPKWVLAQYSYVAGSGSSLLALVVEGIYFAMMESSSTKATLGKMACGLTVVDGMGNRLSFARAAGRYLGKFVSGRFTIGIGYMMAGWTQRKQALHDKMASTYVLKRL